MAAMAQLGDRRKGWQGRRSDAGETGLAATVQDGDETNAQSAATLPLQVVCYFHCSLSLFFTPLFRCLTPSLLFNLSLSLARSHSLLFSPSLSCSVALSLLFSLLPCGRCLRQTLIIPRRGTLFTYYGVEGWSKRTVEDVMTVHAFQRFEIFVE